MTTKIRIAYMEYSELMESAKQLAMHEYKEIGVTIRFEDLPIRMQHQFANIIRRQMMLLKGFHRSFILFPN